mmetsp:Transcript_56739/g.133190  ORF Transcript_56739/g.133190 Transcript_56739/m.133190 type:complete len:223 (+) Transcript_56739:203-871(+)
MRHLWPAVCCSSLTALATSCSQGGSLISSPASYLKSFLVGAGLLLHQEPSACLKATCTCNCCSKLPRVSGRATSRSCAVGDSLLHTESSSWILEKQLEQGSSSEEGMSAHDVATVSASSSHDDTFRIGSVSLDELGKGADCFGCATSVLSTTLGLSWSLQDCGLCCWSCFSEALERDLLLQSRGGEVAALGRLFAPWVSRSVWAGRMQAGKAAATASRSPGS